jgi:hypothetical protein
MKIFNSLAVILLTAFMLCGCMTMPPGRIAVGQQLELAQEELKLVGAEEITYRVGIFYDRKYWSKWYVLPGNTCLHLLAYPREAPKVWSLTVGKKGRGYTVKRSWDRQEKTDIKYLDLK